MHPFPSSHEFPPPAMQRRTDCEPSPKTGVPLLVLLILLLVGALAMMRPLAAAPAISCLSTDTSAWQWEHPRPDGQEARVARWIPEWGKFVAMGDAVISSADGVSWDSLHNFSGWIVNDFVWTGSAFVAVAIDPSLYNGIILRSTDGENWTTVAQGLVGQRGVAWNGSLFVSVGNEATLHTSPDGINWTAVDSGGGQVLGAVVWTGTQFVTVGLDSTILTSPDGATWTPQTAPEPAKSLTDLVWDGSTGTLLAAGFLTGDIWVSTDNAATWQAQKVRSGSNSSITTATIAGGRFWLLNASVETSTVWSAPTSDVSVWSETRPPGVVLDIAWNGIDHVFVGRTGNHGPGVPGRAWRVSDDPLMAEDLRAFTAFEGLAVVGSSSGKLGVSDDQGATWTEVVSSGSGFFHLANNDDPVSPRYIAPRSTDTPGTREILTCAPDIGIDCTEPGHWSAVPYTSFGGSLWRGLEGRFFARSSSGLRSSIDGTSWSIFLLDNAFYGIAHYDDGAALRRWIAVGASGSIRSSDDDGATWNPVVSIGTTDTLLGGLQLGSDVFVWSSQGNLFRTPDGGATWSPVESAPFPVRGLARGEDLDGTPLLVAHTRFEMHTSLDGLDWSDPIGSRAGNFSGSYGIRWDGSTWIQGGSVTVAWAENGLEWQTASDRETYYDLNAAASLGQTTVAAGSAETLLVTVDGGASWQRAQTPVESSFTGLAAGDGVFVAAGDRGGLIRSTDGISWIQTGPPGTTWWRDVAWGDDGFVAVASGGTILHSVDGQTWDQRVSGTTATLDFVGWTGQRYVAVGLATGTGTVVTSLDGIFWQTEPQPIPDFPSYFSASGLAQRGELTVLVGNLQRTWVSTDHGRSWTLGRLGNGFGTPGFTDARLVGSEIVASTAAQLFISNDGINWNTLDMPTANTINDLAVGLDENAQTRLFAFGRGSLALSMPVDRSCDPIPPPPGPVIFVDGFEPVVP